MAGWQRLLDDGRSRWAETFAESLAVVRGIAAQPPPSAAGSVYELLGPGVSLADADFAAEIADAEAREAAQRAALVPKLERLVEEHERQLQSMYAAVQASRASVRGLGAAVAVDRGPLGLSCSAADQSAAAAATVEVRLCPMSRPLCLPSSSAASQLVSPALRLQPPTPSHGLPPVVPGVRARVSAQGGGAGAADKANRARGRPGRRQRGRCRGQRAGHVVGGAADAAACREYRHGAGGAERARARCERCGGGLRRRATFRGGHVSGARWIKIPNPLDRV